MKKTAILAILLAGLASTSCKKDRTCECTFTIVSQTSTDPDFKFDPQPATTTKTTYKEVKKNNVMVESCVSNEDTDTYTSRSYNAPMGGYSDYQVTRVTRNDCELK